MKRRLAGLTACVVVAVLFAGCVTVKHPSAGVAEISVGEFDFKGLGVEFQGHIIAAKSDDTETYSDEAAEPDPAPDPVTDLDPAE